MIEISVLRIEIQHTDVVNGPIKGPPNYVNTIDHLGGWYVGCFF